MRMIIFDPEDEYWKILFGSIAIAFSQLFIGGTLTVILMYLLYINFEDTHIALCTLGYHFFSVEAILSLNYANGWSTLLRYRHRRFAHIFLQVCALSCVLIGTIYVIRPREASRSYRSVHGITGLVSAFLACITFLTGPMALCKGHDLKLLHTTFGIPTFIMSSISLYYGLYTPHFRRWAGVVPIMNGIMTLLQPFSFIGWSTFLIFNSKLAANITK